MKYSIRRGSFETNSSSMHSIVVNNEGTLLTTEEAMKDLGWHLKDGALRIYSEDYLDFGRSPFDVLADVYGKIRYTIASYCGYKSEEDCKDFMESFIEMLQKTLPELKSIVLPETYGDDETAEYYGYIDHQSCGLLQGFLSNNSLTLSDFIFDTRYIVIIDGDEYCIFDKLLDSGMVKKENLKAIYPDDSCDD